MWHLLAAQSKFHQLLCDNNQINVFMPHYSLFSGSGLWEGLEAGDTVYWGKWPLPVLSWPGEWMILNKGFHLAIINGFFLHQRTSAVTFKQLKYILILANRDVPLRRCKCCFFKTSKQQFNFALCAVFFSTQASLSSSMYIGHIRDSLDILYNEVREMHIPDRIHTMSE